MANRTPSYFRLGLMFFALTPAGLHSAYAVPTQKEYASVQSATEQKVDEIRNQEIKAVRTALGLRNPENRKAELYLRLAELYLEAYRSDFLMEGRLQERELQKNPNAKLIRGRSIDDLKYGIGAAETILGLKVEQSKLGQVYFFLGYNYGELGDTKKSLSYYRKLVKEFPDSSFASEGVRALGDEAFQSGDYAEAQSQYEIAVKKAKDPSQLARINHKLAWCYYRQKRSQLAVDTMKRAIDIAKSGGGEKLLSIREEGLRDLAMYYAELGREDEAIAYFKENAGGQDKLVKVLERLGKEYERKGDTDRAKQVYEVLLKADQRDESSFRVSAKMIDLDLMKSKFDSALERLKEIQLPKSGDPETTVALINLKKEVRKTGVSNHDRYRKLDDKVEAKKYLVIADQYYSIYLSKFLSNEKSNLAERNEVRMYLAEVKRDLQLPGQAAELYKHVIQDQDSKYAKEAAQLWVGSLASELKKRAASGEKAGANLSTLEQDFVEASDLLEKNIPNSVESREARLRSSQILAAYPDEKQNAMKRASSLVKDCPGTPQGVLAARLWLELDPSTATVDSLKKSSSLLEQDQKQKGELALDLERASRGLKVSEIKSLEEGKDYLKAAKAYEDFAKGAKTEKEAEGAYVGALKSYAQAGNSEEVARIMREWKAKFPKSKLLESSVKTQATQFFIRGYFKDSAELFLGIGKLLKDQNSYDASAALFRGSEEYAKAKEVLNQSLLLTRSDEEKAQVYIQLAMISKDEKDEASGLAAYKACAALNSSFRAECLSQMGNHYLNHRDTLQAKESFSEVLRIKKGSSSKSNYIAYAQFRLAQLMERDMKKAKLELPEERLVKVLQDRGNELKPVFGAYEKAMELSGPWGIAATERLGDLANELKNEVDDVLRDSRLSDGLKQTLLATSEGLKQKSLGQSKRAYELALKEHFLSPALPVIQDRLAEMGAGSMNRSQGTRSGIKLIGVAPNGGSLGKDDALKRVRENLLKNQEDVLGWLDYGNLLWGMGKPGLSRVAYDRALTINSGSADALNNVAVVILSDLGFENWWAANNALAYWKKALDKEPGNAAALFNSGLIYNYYRLFSLAAPILEKASVKLPIADVYDGLAVAYWGLGKKTEADLESKRAEELGLSSNRFSQKYREAAMVLGSECLDKLNQIPNYAELQGFERVSASRLKQRCEK